MNISSNEFLARVTFENAMREQLPKAELIAEARLLGEPWSVKLRLCSPPDQTGTCMAFAMFLMADAPYVRGTPITLTFGRTVLGTFTILAQFGAEVRKGIEEDFLERGRRHVRRGLGQPCI